MKGLKMVKKSDILMRTLGIVAILLCMVSLVVVSNGNKSITSNQATITKAVSLTNSNTEDLQLEIKATKGGTVLEENSTVYEGEYIEYTMTATNATEETMEDVKLVAQIPEGLKYAILESNFYELRQPYSYSFEDKREETLEIGTLEAGESKTVTYEVKVDDLQEEEEQKPIVTKIDSYIGSNLAQSFQIENVIEKADYQIFMGAFADTYTKRYGLKIKSDEEEQVEVKVHFPKEAEIISMTITELEVIDDYNSYECVEHERGDKATEEKQLYLNESYIVQPEDGKEGIENINEANVTIDEDNVLTATVQTNKKYSFVVDLNENDINRKDKDDLSAEVDAYAEIAEKGYMSNRVRVKVPMQNAEISMTSSNDGEEVRYGDKIDYEITITNTGKNGAQMSEELDFVRLTVLDFLPKNVEPTSITYDNWEIDNNNEEEQKMIKLKKIDPKTEKIVDGVRYDEDGNKLAEIEESLIIPRGETATMHVEATAGMVYKKTEVKNTATINGEEIPSKTSNEVTHIILPIIEEEEETPPGTTPGTDPTPQTSPGMPDMPEVSSTPGNSTTAPSKTSSQGTNNGQSNNTNTQTQNNGAIDFKIDKYISKVTVKTANGVKENTYNNETLVKTEIRAKEINGATVTIEYKIVLTNEGKTAGTVRKVVDKLPEGLTFQPQSNSGWTSGNNNELTNTSKANTVIEPGQSATLTLIATKQMTEENTGTFNNKASIEVATGTSTGADTNLNNNNASAQIVISVSTGAYVYISIVVGALLILTIISLVLYKKGKLNKKLILKSLSKTGKIAMFILVFTSIILMQNTESQAISFGVSAPHYGVYWTPDGSNVASIACDDRGLESGWFDAYGTYGTFNGSVTGQSESPNAGDGQVVKDITLIGGGEIDGKLNGETVTFGPFNYTAQDIENFSLSVYSWAGQLINATPSAYYANGSNSFYLTIPTNSLLNGISKIELKGRGTRIVKRSYTVTYDVKGIISPGTQPADGYVTETITHNDPESFEKTITWTVKSGWFTGLKVDKDNPAKTLAGVKFQITGSNFNRTDVTDQAGKLPMYENVVPGNYTFTELENPIYGYTKPITIPVNILPGQVISIQLENEKQTGNLFINKQNFDSKSPLPGFMFKIQNSKGEYIIAVDSSGPRNRVEGSIILTDLKTTRNIDEATEFITNGSGAIAIYNLLIDNYTVLEISEEDNQFFEAADKKFTAWATSTGEGSGEQPMIVNVVRQKSYDTEKETPSATTPINIYNRQKYVDIGGLVWEEMVKGKKSEVDYTYDGQEPDHLVDNVTVRLVDITTGETVKNRYGDVMEQRSGANGEHGKYLFEKIEIEQIQNYYVEFTYNGLCYQSVPLEAFNNNKEGANVSRATEEGYLDPTRRADFNTKYSIIEKDCAKPTEEDDGFRLNYERPENWVSELTYDGNGNETYGWTCNDPNHDQTLGKSTGNGYRAKYPINDVDEDKFIIHSTTYDLYNGGIDKIKSKDQIRTTDMKVVDNVNLGIYQREQPDLAIMKDLKNVNVSINGYNHIYEYEQRFLHPDQYGDGFNVGAKFKEESKYAEPPYTQAIYESDFEWEDPSNSGRDLQVFLTYRIDISNASTNLKARVNNIVDYFDVRYLTDKREDIKIGTEYQITKIDEKQTRVDIAGQTLGYDFVDSKNSDYKAITIDTSPIGALEHQTTASIYVQFKLSKGAVQSIINKGEMLDNITEITSYSIFDENNQVYAGIDKNSNPGNAEIGNTADKSTWEDDTASAPAVQLEITDARMIQGNVFEDEALTEWLAKNYREGNGILDNTEKLIDDVTVEMVDTDGNRIELWNESASKWDESLSKCETGPRPWEEVLTIDERTMLEENAERAGTYQFKGFIPGEYKIRFTWGDETYYPVQDYKSTIFKQEVHNGKDWYKQTDPRYSDAYDDWNQRLLIDAQMQKQVFDTYINPLQPADLNTYYPPERYPDGVTDSNGLINKITANTPDFEIGVEYDEITSAMSDNRFAYLVGNVDLGIIKRPEQKVELDKEITKIEVVRNDGTPVISAEVQPVPGNPIINGFANGFTYTTPSLGNEDYPKGRYDLIRGMDELQGTSIKITYKLTVTNNSEYDYVDEDFNIGGTSIPNPKNIVTMKVNKLNDYLDKDWTYNANNNTSSTWNTMDANDVQGNVDSTVYQELSRNKVKIVQTENLNTKQLKPRESCDIDITASNDLSTKSGFDIELDNEAEIIELYKTGGAKLKDTVCANFIPGDWANSNKELDSTKAETFTIIPPTGAINTIAIISVTSVIALIVIGVGVVVIKKKVIK